MSAVERRRAALVSADAAGYSRLMAADELATIKTIKVFREAGEEIALEHSGRLVDSPGDNLLFEFEEPAGALQASLRFQQFVRETNEGFEPDDRMQFRMGVHCGEVVVDNDRIYGSGINIAARLERLARPGGICISDSVCEQLEATPDSRTSARSTSRTSRTRSTRSSSMCRGRRYRSGRRCRPGPRSRCCRSTRPRTIPTRSTSPTG